MGGGRRNKLLVFLLYFILLTIVFSSIVFAVHTSSVFVIPTFAKPSISVKYNFTVFNTGGNDIDRIRITRPDSGGWSSVSCGTTTGWSLSSSDSVTCSYATTTNLIKNSGNETFTVTVTTPAEGNYTWQVRTQDIGDAFIILNPTIVIDDTPPTTSFSLDKTPNAAAWINSDVNVTLTCTDSASGCFITLFVNDTTNTTEPNTIGKSLKLIGEGSNFVRFKSNDTLNNGENVKTTFNITIDKTKPVISNVNSTGIVLVGATKYVKGIIKANATVTDALSGLNSTAVRFSLGTAKCTATNLSNEWFCNIDTTLTLDGTYDLKVESVDLADNIATDISLSLVVDNTIPFITEYKLNSTAPGKGTTDAYFNPNLGQWIDLSFKANEIIKTWTSFKIFREGNESGISKNRTPSAFDGTDKANLTWTGDLSNGVLEDGSYIVRVNIKDNADNENNTILNPKIFVDTKKPVVFFNQTNKTGNEEVTIKFNGTLSTDENGIISFFWQFGDGATSTLSKPNKTYADNGVFSVNLTITDPASNINSTVNSVTVTNNAPTINSFTNDGPINEGNFINITITATDVAADLPLKFDFNCGNTSSSVVDQTSNIYKCFYINQGAFTANVSAKDKDDGVRNASTGVTVNNVAPTITSTPVTSAQVNKAYTYDVDATDPGADILTFRLEIAPEGMGITSSLGNITWTPKSTQKGKINVTVNVTDGDGGFDKQSFTIDVSSYVISLASGQNLFSPSLVSDKRSVNDFFGTAISDVDSIWIYNASSETWDFFKDGVHDGVKEITPGRGYFINMKATRTINGTADKMFKTGNFTFPPSFRLYDGWNLIGHYGVLEVEKGAALDDSLKTDHVTYGNLIDASGTSVTKLSENRGYWLFIKCLVTNTRCSIVYAPSNTSYAFE